MTTESGATAAGPLRLERQGALAVMTIDHPPLNLFDSSMIEALRGHVDALEEPGVRGLLVRAEGAVVSAGVDVDVFHGLSSADAATLWTDLLEVIHRIERLPYPTVFAAHALTLTAAFELALGCDLIVAAESAQFGLVETVVGLTPAMGGTQRIADRAGPGRARELVMTGALFPAGTLERWNVVNRVWEDEGFDARARKFANRLATGPTLAHAATKRIVRAQIEDGVPGADAVVPETAGNLFDTKDLKKAVETFLDQGPGNATFEGR